MKNKELSKQMSPVPECGLEEHAFVMSFLLDQNRAAAARRCGICDKTARKWLQKPGVQALITRKAREIEQVCDVTLAECLNELKKIAFFKHQEYAKDFKFEVEEGCLGVTLEDFKDMDTSAIASMNMKVNSQGVPYVEIRPYNKIEALKELIAHLKGYQGPSSVHLHINSADAKKMSAQEIAARYQVAVRGDSD